MSVRDMIARKYSRVPGVSEWLKEHPDDDLGGKVWFRKHDCKPPHLMIMPDGKEFDIRER